jgi:hypothetical protein
MFTVPQLLCALLLSSGLAALLTCMGRELRAPFGGTAHGGVGGLMLVVTVMVAHAATAVAVDAGLVPPLLGWHWLPWAGLAVVPLLLVALPRRLATPSKTPAATAEIWRWSAVALVAAGGAWLILQPLPFSSAFTRAHLLGGALAAAVISVVAGFASVPTLDSSPLLQRMSALISSAGIAAGILATGSKDLALFAGILPLAILGGGLAAWAVERGPWSGGVLVTAMISSWNLLLAASYSELPWWIAPIFALALPLGLAAGQLGTTPRRRAAWQLGTTTLVIVIALALATTLGQPAAFNGIYGTSY